MSEHKDQQQNALTDHGRLYLSTRSLDWWNVVRTHMQANHPEAPLFHLRRPNPITRDAHESALLAYVQKEMPKPADQRRLGTEDLAKFFNESS